MVSIITGIMENKKTAAGIKSSEIDQGGLHMDRLNLIYSCLLHKDDKQIVRVTFEETDSKGGKFAEGIVPDGIIEKQKGFTEEEIVQLETYLQTHTEDIFAKAKEISGIMHWMK